MVQITATYASSAAAQAATATYADMMHNKRLAFVLQKDDSNVSDYSVVYPLVIGGTVFGQSVPGLRYPDGAGNQLPIGFGFALIGAGLDEDGSNQLIMSAAKYREMLLNRGFCPINHTYYHDNRTPALNVQLGTEVIQRTLNRKTTCLVLPTGLPDLVDPAVSQGYNNITSQGYGSGNSDSAGSYQTRISYGERVPVSFIKQQLALTPSLMICNRWFFDDQLVPGIPDLKAWVDQRFQLAANDKIVCHAFGHQPDSLSQALALQELVTYINTHPQNIGGNDVWFPNSQQLTDYYLTQQKAIVAAPVVSGNTVTFSYNVSQVGTTYQDMTLLLSGTPTAVTVTGADSYSVSGNKSLVNLYTMASGIQTKPAVGGPVVTIPSNVPRLRWNLTPTTSSTIGEIPFVAYRGFVEDHSTQNFTALVNGSFLDNFADQLYSGLIPAARIVLPFPVETQARISEVWLGTGDGGITSLPTAFIDPLFANVAGPVFTNVATDGKWQKFILSTPVRADYFTFGKGYPLPTEVKFFGQFIPYSKPRARQLIPVEQHIGSVIHSWNLQLPSGNGLSTNKLAVADTLHAFRYYIDYGLLSYEPGGVDSGLVALSPTATGGWKTDQALQWLSEHGKDTILCIKVNEGKNKYIELVRQAVIRWGANPNVPDNLVRIFTGPDYPANVIRKGLGYIRKVQLGNEMNRWWKGRANIPGQTNLEGYMSPAEYAQRVYDCNTAIKAIDPTMEVIVGGFASNNPAYFAGMVLYWRQHGLGLPCDALSYHDYNNTEGGQNQTGGAPAGVAPEANGMYERAVTMQQLLHELSPTKRIKVYITETGYSIADPVTGNQNNVAATLPGRDRFQTQADWSVRTVLTMLRAGNDGTMFYQLYDDDNFIYNPTGYMGWDYSCGIAQKDGNNDTDQASLRPTTRHLKQVSDLLAGYVMSIPASFPWQAVTVDVFTKTGSPTIVALTKPTMDGSTTNYVFNAPNGGTLYRLSDTTTTPSTSPLLVGNNTISVKETACFVVLN